MTDNNDKITNLISLGLSELEAQVYMFLISRGPSTALIISRSLDVPRTSIYDTLTRLNSHGLVAQVLRHKTTQYKASPIEAFHKIISEQEDKLSNMSSSLKNLESLLANQAKDLQNTEVRYYQGPEGLRQMIWNCLKAKQEIVGYSVFGRVEVVGNTFYQKFVKEFDSRGLSDRVIANPTKRTMDYIFKDVKPGFHQLSFQNIRTLEEKKLYIAGDTMIYNNIYAVSYWQGHEVVGVEIENPDFVRHELSIFELLWELARPISSSLK